MSVDSSGQEFESHNRPVEFESVRGDLERLIQIPIEQRNFEDWQRIKELKEVRAGILTKAKDGKFFGDIDLIIGDLHKKILNLDVNQAQGLLDALESGEAMEDGNKFVPAEYSEYLKKGFLGTRKEYYHQGIIRVIEEYNKNHNFAEFRADDLIESWEWNPQGGENQDETKGKLRRIWEGIVKERMKKGMENNIKTAGVPRSFTEINWRKHGKDTWSLLSEAEWGPALWDLVKYILKQWGAEVKAK